MSTGEPQAPVYPLSLRLAGRRAVVAALAGERRVREDDFDVVAAIRDGAAPPVNARDAMIGLEIIEAAQRSATERRIVAT